MFHRENLEKIVKHRSKEAIAKAQERKNKRLIEQSDKIINKMEKRTEGQTNELLGKLVRSKLNEGIIKFTYHKKNGDLREAEGTTCMLCIPVDDQPKGIQSDSDPNMIRYYDTNSGGWRTFLIENLISID